MCVWVCGWFGTGTRETSKGLVSTWFLLRTSSVQMLLGRIACHLHRVLLFCSFAATDVAASLSHVTRLYILIPNSSSISMRYLISTQKPSSNRTLSSRNEEGENINGDGEPASSRRSFSQEHVPAWQGAEVPGGHAASETDCID